MAVLVVSAQQNRSSDRSGTEELFLGDRGCTALVWREERGLEMDIGATREELGDFLPGLPSFSWEMLPKALHTPSSISTTQGDVLISAAFPIVQWQAAALLACQDLYTHLQPSSHPPQTFLVGSPFLIYIFGQLFSHLSWIPCV